MEDGNYLNKSVYGALRVLQFTILTGLQKSPFELQQGCCSKTELTNRTKDWEKIRLGKNYPILNLKSWKS